MTKKHFIALADAMRTTKPESEIDIMGVASSEYTAELAQWKQDVNIIALVCASHNPQFNRERWLAYIAGECGPNGGPITGGIHKGRMRTL